MTKFIKIIPFLLVALFLLCINIYDVDTKSKLASAILVCFMNIAILYKLKLSKKRGITLAIFIAISLIGMTAFIYV